MAGTRHRKEACASRLLVQPACYTGLLRGRRPPSCGALDTHPRADRPSAKVSWDLRRSGPWRQHSTASQAIAVCMHAPMHVATGPWRGQVQACSAGRTGVHEERAVVACSGEFAANWSVWYPWQWNCPLAARDSACIAHAGATVASCWHAVDALKWVLLASTQCLRLQSRRLPLTAADQTQATTIT